MRQKSPGLSVLVFTVATLGVAWNLQLAVAQNNDPPKPQRVDSSTKAEAPNMPPVPPGDANNIDAIYSYYVERNQTNNGIQFDEWWQIDKAAAGLERRRDYERQLQLLKIELQVFEREYGKDSLECVNVLELLAECCKKFNKASESDAYRKEVAQILSRGKSKIEASSSLKHMSSDPYSGEDNNLVVSSLIGRGEIYAKRDDKQTAIKYFKKGLAEADRPLKGAFEKISNESTRMVMQKQAESSRKSFRAAALRNLASAYAALHQNENAIATYEKLVPIVDKIEQPRIVNLIDKLKKKQ